METLNLVKGQTLDLKKSDGTSISKIRVGLSWDTTKTSGYDVDLDLFVVAKETKTVAYFNAKTAIKGIALGDDNLTGAGDGDDETADFDATVSEDGTYIVCINIFEATSRGQDLSHVNNASARVYCIDTGAILAEFKMTENGGSNTGIIVGEIKDTGDNYTFTARGDFVNGNINQIAASI